MSIEPIGTIHSQDSIALVNKAMQIAVNDTMKAAETVLAGAVAQAAAGQVSENAGRAAQSLVNMSA